MTEPNTSEVQPIDEEREQGPKPQHPLTRIRTTALSTLIAVVIGVIVLSINPFGSGGDAGAAFDDDTGALAVAAADLVNLATRAGGAADAVGGYLPGTGVVLTVHHDRLVDTEITTWIANHVQPFVDRTVLPEGEAVVVTVDVASPMPSARIFTLDPQSPEPMPRVAPAISVGPAPSVAAEAPASSEVVPASVASEPSPSEAIGLAAAPGAGEPLLAGSLWSPIVGSWIFDDGVYRQTDATAFGQASEYLGDVPAAFDLGVSMRAIDGDLNAGLIVGKPELGTKNGATVIDITGENTYLRWGRYDDATGEWAFIGGAPIEPPLVPSEWNDLELRVRPSGMTIVLNGSELATIDPVDPGGVALVTSVAQVEFRDLTLQAAADELAEVPMSPTEPAPSSQPQPQPSSQPQPSPSDAADAADDAAMCLLPDADTDTDIDAGTDTTAAGAEGSFADPSLADWQILAGAWTAEGGVLRQGNGQAYDQMIQMRSPSSDNYRVEVSARPADGSTFGGGLLFNIDELGARSGSHVFDVIDEGRFARWGEYDENGVYSYIGGLSVELEAEAGAWTTIAIEVIDGRAIFFVDDAQIGASTDVGAEGHVGLVTSIAAMDFRDFTIEDR